MELPKLRKSQRYRLRSFVHKTISNMIMLFIGFQFKDAVYSTFGLDKMGEFNSVSIWSIWIVSACIGVIIASLSNMYILET